MAMTLTIFTTPSLCQMVWFLMQRKQGIYMCTAGSELVWTHKESHKPHHSLSTCLNTNKKSRRPDLSCEVKLAFFPQSSFQMHLRIKKNKKKSVWKFSVCS